MQVDEAERGLTQSSNPNIHNPEGGESVISKVPAEGVNAKIQGT